MPEHGGDILSELQELTEKELLETKIDAQLDLLRYVTSARGRIWLEAHPCSLLSKLARLFWFLLEFCDKPRWGTILVDGEICYADMESLRVDDTDE